MSEEKNVYRNNWLSVYASFGRLCLRISPASYFDDRAHINIYATTILGILGFIIQAFGILPSVFILLWSLLIVIPFGQLFIDLPIHSGIDDAEYPQYGFYFFGDGKTFDCFVWCWNKKTYHMYMPWSWDWVRTSYQLIDKSTGLYYWEHSTKGNRKDFDKSPLKELIRYEEYPYTYYLKSGKMQNVIATLHSEEREWRWKWFKWLKYPSRICRDISIEFNGEVGERAGSWKGGTIGCSYTLRPNETWLECLRRMEQERKF